MDDLFNTADGSETMDKTITLSQALMVLGSEESLLLSDLRKVDSLKEAMDEFAKLAVETKVKEIKDDEEFKLSLVETIDTEKLLENKAVQACIEAYTTKVEQCRTDVGEIAKKNEIKLSGPHKYLVLSAINTVMSEQEILTKIKETVKLTDLSEVPDFFLKSDKKPDEKGSMVGIKFDDDSGDKASVQAEPTISL